MENYRDFYEFEAKVYRTTVEKEPAALHRLGLVKSLLPGEKGDWALDVGCGDGVICGELVRKGYPRVVGLDLALQRVCFAKDHSPRACYLEGDIYRLPFKDSLFHLVTCADLLEHLESPQAGLNELVRVARRFLLITVPYSIVPEKTLCPHCRKTFYLYGHLHSFGKDRLEQMVREAGGRVIRFRHRIPLFECRRYRYFPFLKWLLWSHFKNTGTLGVLAEKV